MVNKPSVAVVGFGRFGKLLTAILSRDFEVVVFEKDKKNRVKGVNFVSKLDEIYKSDTIFFAVPIDKFEKILVDHKKYFLPKHLLIDVLSVKKYPKELFKKHLPAGVKALLTHPMFGPDSVKKAGLEGLPIVMDRFTCDQERYLYWKKYFEYLKLKVIEMKAEEHDELLSKSQGITHFMGRLVNEVGFKSTPIDTLGDKLLHAVVDQTCNDSLDLFRNIEIFNPNTKKLRAKIDDAYTKLFEELIPNKSATEKLLVGICKDKDFLAESAFNEYNAKSKSEITNNFKLKNYDSTEKILKNLQLGNIDIGIFPLQSTSKGLYLEVLKLIAQYKFKLVDEIVVNESYCLMKRKDVDISKITHVISEDEIHKKCNLTMTKKYDKLGRVVGKGDFVELVKSAKAITEGNLPVNLAILGNKELSKKFDLEIIDNNLQDTENKYLFIVAQR